MSRKKTSTTDKPDAAGCAKWDQREKEAAHEYAAFRLYLNLAHPRASAKVAREIGIPPRTADRWRTKNDWVERAEAFDAHQMQKAVDVAAVNNPAAENPYEVALRQQVSRAQRLHEITEQLLQSAGARLIHTNKMYQRSVDAAKAKKEDWEAIPPPIPERDIVAVIRGCNDVLKGTTEAQAMALGITDVLAMAARGAVSGGSQ